MPLSDDLCKKIANAALAGNQAEVFNLLKENLNNENAIQDVLIYARDYLFKNKQPKTYAVDVVTINNLGYFISNSSDPTQSKYAIEFYKLAAERDYAMGNSNLAYCLLAGLCGVSKSPQEALKYAKKAVKLSENIPNERHEYKLILSQALRANNLGKEANIALIEFLDCKILQDNFDQPAIKQQINTAISLLMNILNEYKSRLDNNNILPDEQYKSILITLEPILNYNINYDPFLFLKNYALFIKGKCFERLNENSQAWLIYCSFIDKNLSFYKEIITAQANLLKKEINTLKQPLLLSKMASLAIDDKVENKLTARESESADLLLPQGFPLPAKFEDSWKKEAAWFYSVDTITMEAEYKKSLAQIEKLISIKQEEIAVINDIQKDIKNANEFAQQKQLLAASLEKLKLIKKKVEEKYTKYLPEKRRTFRRHAAEIHFFNPKRSKKASELIKLTEQIIDQRYNLDNAQAPTINLKGISARLFITAERIFQEAVIKLSGKDTVKLGIPVARDKTFIINNFGDSTTLGYGPIEYYQVDNTIIKSEHRTNPKSQRLGDSLLPEVGTYSNKIYPLLFRLTHEEIEKEKKLAYFMIRYGNNHQPITLDELKLIYVEANENDVNDFNQVCFLLLEKEQVQWHSASVEDYQLGMSIAQARCLIMIAEGYITFKEAFQINALFSVYSKNNLFNNISEVAKSCKYIDNLYLTYLQAKNTSDHMRFFKTYIKDEQQRQCILTREQAHLDLNHVYGGNSDSDTEDEGYHSDLSI